MSEKNRVLDIDIERYVLGELPADRAAAVETALREDPSAAARIDALKADNAAILEAYPSHLMAVQIRERAERAVPERGHATRRVLIPAASFSVAVAAAVAAVMLTPDAIPEGAGGAEHVRVQTEPGIRTKGLEPKLFMYRLGDKGKEPLEDGQTAKEGDIIQWTYAALGQRYGVIFSLDGRGAVTLHFPSDPSGSTKLAKGTNDLDYSYELDDAPQFERFFFVTANKPIDIPALLDKGKQAGESGDLALAPGAVSSEFILKKP